MELWCKGEGGVTISDPPWGLYLWSTSSLCDMSKQQGPGFGAHILSAVPGGPFENTTDE